MLTLDIKGAFDAILSGRLVRRLREQGWPNHLVSWAASFATNRTVQVRLDGETGPQQKVSCGLSQGSPISPILFTLYISPLFKLDENVSRLGYADDMAILATNKTLEENCVSLQLSLERALSWGEKEGIIFDPRKSELQYFSRHRKDIKPSNTLSVSYVNFAVSENLSHPYTRSLGIHFDKTLSFKWHIRILAGKALRVANALRSLNNYSRGSSRNLNDRPL